MFKLISLVIILVASVIRAEKPLTFKQFEALKELEEVPFSLTFEYDVTQIEDRFTGYWGPGNMPAPVRKYRGDKLKAIDLSKSGKLSPTLNQGSCGSCVVFAVLSTWMDTMQLRGLKFPMLSAQHLMNCGGNAGQCSGDYGARVSQRLVNLKTLFSNADYPYTARSANCSEKNRDGERYGKIESYETLEGSAQSILAALNDHQPIAVGIAANGSWGSYRSGIYNACNSSSINHYIEIVGMTCGESVDKDGYCVFKENGELPPGQGTFIVRNSWGTGWGQGGFGEMKISDRNGRRCNAIAAGEGNAQILVTGIPIPPKEPVTFIVESKDVKLTITIQPTAEYSVEEANKLFTQLLETL